MKFGALGTDFGKNKSVFFCQKMQIQKQIFSIVMSFEVANSFRTVTRGDDKSWRFLSVPCVVRGKQKAIPQNFMTGPSNT